MHALKKSGSSILTRSRRSTSLSEEATPSSMARSNSMQDISADGPVDSTTRTEAVVATPTKRHTLKSILGVPDKIPSSSDTEVSPPTKPSSPSPPGMDDLRQRVAALERLLARQEDDVAEQINGMVRTQLKETVETYSKRMVKVFEEVDQFKHEAIELSARLREQLAQLEVRQKTMTEMLERAPDLAVFPAGRVKLRVGEHVFHTSTATLQRHPTSMLAAMFSGKFQLTKDEEGCYFIDRDGAAFVHILDFLRSSQPPTDLTPAERVVLLREAEFYGLEVLSRALQKDMQEQKEDDQQQAGEQSTMANIQSIATTNFVQSVIASLAEVTHLAFRQMAADAERGAQETMLTFQVGQLYHNFFVNPDGSVKNTLPIFLELLRQEGAVCQLVSPSASSQAVVIRCSLLRSDKDICAEVLRSFKKMRGFRKIQ